MNRDDTRRRPSGAPNSFALIIGGMKCGTTSLFELLAQHPEICGSGEKEPHFFASVQEPSEAWERYLALWKWRPERHRIALEASTSCAKYPWVKDVPEKIARSPGGRFRFIYMMRDPVRRIASQVRHSLYEGWGRSLDDEGLTEDLIDFSRYAMQLDRYTALFPREDILLLTLEELKTDPAAVLRSACAFLGVSSRHHFTEVDQPRNVGDFYTVPSLLSSVAKSRATRWATTHLLTGGGKRRLRRFVARHGSRGGESIGRWQLNEEEAAYVRRALADDMARLRGHYGVEAPWLVDERSRQVV